MKTEFVVLFSLIAAAALPAQEWKPFDVVWNPRGKVEADVSFLLEKPAGKAGFIGVRDGHLVDGAGKRFRIWGVNLSFTGSFPKKEDAPAYAAHLARFGVNCVRIHHHDWRSPRGLIDAKFADSRHLDPEMLDRLDFFVNELKKAGVYTDLNLNVARAFQEGDGVKDAKQLGFGKAVTIFDPRIIELEKEFARQYLTHRNPYTGNEYRNEPAVALIEILNENSLVESWKAGRLVGNGPAPGQADQTWTDIPASYASYLDGRYQAFLQFRLTPEQLAAVRTEAGGESVPRLKPAEFAKASALRFQTEAAFYMDLETRFYRNFREFLKDELSVKMPVIGSSIHNGGLTPYPLVASTALLDVVDGHTYWQHPRYFYEGGKRLFEIKNTPMVDDPAQSTVMTLSRVAVAGKPYTVSEVNHPFPNEYGAEMIPILASYGAFHDWDGIFWYSFSHSSPDAWKQGPMTFFDIRNDPVKMTQMAAGALQWLRGDVAPAGTTVVRDYGEASVRASLRLDGSQRPYFTPGMPALLPLRHGMRIGKLNGADTAKWPDATGASVASDTGELVWAAGQVTTNTARSASVTGRWKEASFPWGRLSGTLEFSAAMVHSLDGKPIGEASRLLVTYAGKYGNTGAVWNEKRTSTVESGTGPARIECGTLTLTLQAKGAKGVEAQPLDGGGTAMRAPVQAERTAGGWQVPLAAGTLWYVVRVMR